MKPILQKLIAHEVLTQTESYEVLKNIANNCYNESQVTAFINVYMMRKISINEVLGFRKALLDLAILIDLENRLCLDIVGSGGDEKNSFNISTLACFVAVGAGIQISKHGNYAASSTTGASTIMEHFGYKFSNSEQKIKTEIDKFGITFLHAPMFHPALKSVGGIRKNLKLRTIFNLLGPLVNPCQPLYNLVGVYNLELMRLYQYVFQTLHKKFMLVHSLDGFDEVSLTADTKIITTEYEKILPQKQLTPLSISEADLAGGNSTEDAAKIFINVLENKATATQTEVVVTNAAFAILHAQKAKNFDEAKKIATESLVSRKALNVFTQLMNNQK